MVHDWGGWGTLAWAGAHLESLCCMCRSVWEAGRVQCRRSITGAKKRRQKCDIPTCTLACWHAVTASCEHMHLSGRLKP